MASRTGNLSEAQRQVELLIALALDLLAQVEAQHRETRRLERQLQALRVQTRMQAEGRAARKDMRKQVATLQSHLTSLTRQSAAERRTLSELRRAARQFRRSAFKSAT